MIGFVLSLLAFAGIVIITTYLYKQYRAVSGIVVAVLQDGQDFGEQEEDDEILPQGYQNMAVLQMELWIMAVVGVLALGAIYYYTAAIFA